ncbi:Ubiquitin-conjugating enzyme/RWD-like protein [Moelleriella libera RCEF 2490]|uniref:Ubiquitin-conjugating enzyme/RWD-like protein n=1 Tax=Moelleriella libera RCEF 2490 TaxID=1081109 RepID=A0A162IJI4_9HYPO|nr:Ubiquitin-conjugating enzyme/RWD-like protein [Moelleriella libera RCEF 2490]
MPVQQHVLNWLYSVLTSEYHDVNRTYNHVAQALTQCPTISPRTDVHSKKTRTPLGVHFQPSTSRPNNAYVAFPNGSSALLLHLTGTIPVNFRGSIYRFPISIWLPHAYPREPPLVYVTPAENMIVRPGQHVDPQGQVYHPYLVGWAQFWDKSNIQDFLSVLADIFAKEPPVVSKPVNRPPWQQERSIQSPSPLSYPPPAPNTASQNSNTQSQAPPPPPKEHRELSSSHHPSQSTSLNASSSRYDSAPPLPPQAQATPLTDRHSQHAVGQFQQHHQHQPGFLPSSTSHVPSPPVPHGLSTRDSSYSSQAVTSQHASQWLSQNQPPPGYAAHSQSKQAFERQQLPQSAAAPPNILDEPLTLDIPADTAVAPPPIPPNPEKDNLLRQLAQTLYVTRQRTRQQNESSMAGLQAQRAAMQQAMAGLQSESSQLTQLSNVLTSNTNILHEALRKADAVIEGSRRHPAPDIDELLVAPTVVSNQLYNLVAEERALGDAIFMLGRAVERGRMSPAVFAKTTRSLAREWYLKKALVRKIGQGMGLA